jgi:hypothetical protein
MRTLLVAFAVILSVVPARAQMDLLDVQSQINGYSTRGYNLGGDEQNLYRSLAQGVGQAAPEARMYSYAGGGVNILVLGDGYRNEDYPRYQALAQRAANALFANQVVQEAQAGHKLKLWPYFVPSAEAGASTYYGQGTRNTALGATFRNHHQGDTTIWVNFQTAWSVAQRISSSFSYILVLVNAGQYAAMYWDYGVCIVSDFDRLTGVSNPVTFEDIVCHELLGHTVSGLWDEYVYNGKPNVPVTQSPNCDASGQSPKWYGMVGWQPYNWSYTAVGAYPGCAMSSYYRPTENSCKMNTWAQMPFCPVCKRQIQYVLSRY